jgi:hypothetical protein
MKKVFILTICTFFLTAQLYVIFFPNKLIWDPEKEVASNTFYPFLNFPMYAVRLDPEKKYIQNQLRVYTSAKDSFIIVGSGKLKIIGTNFRNLLDSAIKIFDSTKTIDSYDKNNFNILNGHILNMVSDNCQTAEIWQSKFSVNEAGQIIYDTPWLLFSSWEIKQK